MNGAVAVCLTSLVRVGMGVVTSNELVVISFVSAL